MALMSKAVRRWLRGWVGAAIAAGANTLSTGLSVVVIDPATFNFGAGFTNLVKAVGIGALVQAAVGAALFLSKSPLPPEEEDEPAQSLGRILPPPARD